MSSLLEQAIIDAKTLKETALRNAEAAILEQYSEEIKQSMQSLLEQDEGIGDTTGADLGATASPEKPKITPAGGGKVPLNASQKLMSNINSSYLNEDGLQEIEINLDSLVEKVSEFENNISSVSNVTQVSDTPVVPQTVSRMPQDVTPLAETFEIDEELLNEEEMSVDTSEEDKRIADADKAKAEAAKAKAEKQANAAKEAQAKKETDAAKTKTPVMAVPAAPLEEEFSLEEEMMLDIANVSKGGVDASEIELEKQKDIRDALIAQNAELADELEEKEREKTSLEETLDAAINQLKETKEKLLKSAELNKQLSEGVEYLSKKFNLVNLLNAKLLYTNKALGNSSLNERQKEQIAESISSASSVEEAKTIYETLQKSAAVLTEKRSAPKSLTEALNKAPSPFLPRKQAQNESTADRWKLLAGIKK
jgi:hypothetical protein